MNGAAGKHIKVRLYGVHFDRLKNTELARRFLGEAVAAAGMRTLDEPKVYDVKEELERCGVEPDASEPEGVTGVVVLSTSHVAIHTWPHRGYANIDVYSCRNFDDDAIVRVAGQVYGYHALKLDDLSYSLDLPPMEPGGAE
jgi:S-adenosylmethionine decarboxylase